MKTFTRDGRTIFYEYKRGNLFKADRWAVYDTEDKANKAMYVHADKVRLDVLIDIFLEELKSPNIYPKVNRFHASLHRPRK